MRIIKKEVIFMMTIIGILFILLLFKTVIIGAPVIGLLLLLLVVDVMVGKKILKGIFRKIKGFFS